MNISDSHMETKPRNTMQIVMRILTPLLIIGVGSAVFFYFKMTSTKIKRKPPKPSITTVDVLVTQTRDAQTVIHAMGTVTPSHEITLRSRITGEITEVSPDFVPGGYIAKDGLILKIDPTDYEVEVQKAQSALTTAQANYEIEQGSQAIAREELRLLEQTSEDSISDTDLALRQPQLKQAQAAVESAKADLAKAMLNLNRTRIKSPFNAMVTQRNVDLGAHINTQDALATLVSTDEYWIETTVPLDRISMLDLEKPDNSPVFVQSQSSSGKWEGRLLRITGKLNEKSRMASVIIGISDPLGLKPGKHHSMLLIGDYVSVQISGKIIESVIELPRLALKGGNTVWVYQNQALDIRHVVPVWKQGDQVYIKTGLGDGDQVIVSDVPMPVQGMQLSVINPVDNAKPLAQADSKDL